MAHVYILFFKDKSILNGPRDQDAFRHPQRPRQSTCSTMGSTASTSYIIKNGPWSPRDRNTHTHKQYPHKFLTIPHYLKCFQVIKILWDFSSNLHKLNHEFIKYQLCSSKIDMAHVYILLFKDKWSQSDQDALGHPQRPRQAQPRGIQQVPVMFITLGPTHTHTQKGQMG